MSSLGCDPNALNHKTKRKKHLYVPNLLPFYTPHAKKTKYKMEYDHNIYKKYLRVLV